MFMVFSHYDEGKIARFSCVGLKHHEIQHVWLFEEEAYSPFPIYRPLRRPRHLLRLGLQTSLNFVLDDSIYRSRKAGSALSCQIIN